MDRICSRMDEHRSPKAALNYTPKVKRSKERILGTSESSGGTDPGSTSQRRHEVYYEAEMTTRKQAKSITSEVLWLLTRNVDLVLPYRKR